MLSVKWLIFCLTIIFVTSIAAEEMFGQGKSYLSGQNQASTIENIATEYKRNKSNPCVEVKGSASLDGVSEAFARKMAIRDALKMASLKANVKVHTSQRVEDYQLVQDSARFTSQSKIKNYRLLKEGLESAEDQYGQPKERPLNYEVVLQVCLTEEAGICPGLEGNQYQTRLAIAPVVIPFASEARDIVNLLPGYQVELESRLQEKGYRNVEVLSQSVEVRPDQLIRPNLEAKKLSDIWSQTGAQFLLLTVIRTMSVHSDTGILNTAKRFYNIHVSPDTRFVEIEWYVVDLINHSILHQSVEKREISQHVLVGRERPFGSNAFFVTETGKAFDGLLNQQVQDVMEALHCQPFESRVIDIQDDEYMIYLHRTAGAKVGDDLAVYHLKGRPVQVAGKILGQRRVPGAFLKITHLYPNFAVAELSAQKGRVQIGDTVKVW